MSDELETAYRDDLREQCEQISTSERRYIRIVVHVDEVLSLLNDAARLADAERNEGTLLGMIRHQRDVLRECLPYLNESMAGRRPGRSADDIRAAVKALTADSASGKCCEFYAATGQHAFGCKGAPDQPEAAANGR